MNNFLLLLFIATALSMDAVAVSISISISSKNNFKILHSFYLALWFGSFQTIMPLIGWKLGNASLKYIRDYDHWIAFALLTIIGIKMIIETLRNPNNQKEKYDLKIHNLLLLSIATSIDAFAVGLSISLLKLPLFASAAIIGITTFILTSFSSLIGMKIGKYLGSKAEIIGGIILIAVAFKILLEHLKIGSGLAI